MAHTTLTDRVLDTLVAAGLLTSEQLTAVRESGAPGSQTAATLIERGLVTPADVGSILEEDLGVPQVDLTSYAPDEDALALVPADVARANSMLPLFEIDGTLTVAIGDAMDVFALDAVSEQLGLEMDPVLTDPASIAAALGQYYSEDRERERSAAAPAAAAARSASEIARSLEAFASAEPDIAPAEAPAAVEEAPAPEPEPAAEEEPYAEEPEGFEPMAPAEAPEPEEEPAEPMPEPETLEQMAAAPAAAESSGIDLDVLAVADPTKVSLLVAEILSDAARKGATRIHLLPYKDDFFLVYRVRGRLEKVASAAHSLQGALIDGFRSFARITGTPANVPALGRVRAHLADRDLSLTVSVVPTIAGQRMVISLAPLRSEPAGLSALGMNEAEERALHAMVERGRGILLVAAPVSEGRSSTYYALLARAAAVGKTVYSVERAIEYEIPAVAQVLVNPGSSIGASAYLAVGMRQDTDVLAIDGLTTLADIELAVEAAGAGRLVIATFAAGGIAEAVGRMLAMGAEPHGLAAALTLGVGQRLVRRTCPQCAAESPSRMLQSLPGLPKGTVNIAGAGCPSCQNTGFAGVAGIFEVLPFTGPVRAAIARAGDVDAVQAAALAAGMRPLLASGAARVAAGQVSAEELDRVLGFAGT